LQFIFEVKIKIGALHKYKRKNCAICQGKKQDRTEDQYDAPPCPFCELSFRQSFENKRAHADA
jgi:hypothetical protein